MRFGRARFGQQTNAAAAGEHDALWASSFLVSTGAPLPRAGTMRFGRAYVVQQAHGREARGRAQHGGEHSRQRVSTTVSARLGQLAFDCDASSRSARLTAGRACHSVSCPERSRRMIEEMVSQVRHRAARGSGTTDRLAAPITRDANAARCQRPAGQNRGRWTARTATPGLAAAAAFLLGGFARALSIGFEMLLQRRRESRKERGFLVILAVPDAGG